jgi:formate dehydrogenase iron-sulfur subunit
MGAKWARQEGRVMHDENSQYWAEIVGRIARAQPDVRGGLLPLLHAVQAEAGYIDNAAIPPIAELLNLSRAEVLGVISFYHDFRREPPPSRVVKLCRAEACQARDATAMAEKLEAAFPDVAFEPVYCLGLCATGPSALVDDRPVAPVDPATLAVALQSSEQPAHPAPKGPRVYISHDSASVALGADALADAFAAAGCAVIRTGSRGHFAIEPLVEVETAEGRIGFGPVGPQDVAAILAGTHPNRLGDVTALPFLARQQRLTFARVGIIDPLAPHDWSALAKARAMSPQAVVDAVKASGLRGRGGAGFPAGIKWQTVLDAPGAEKFIVCNADEGDSGTFADRMLMEGDPALLIEGMAIAAHAVGAAHGYVYIRSEYPLAIRTMQAAIDLAAPRIAPFTLEVRVGAGAYVCGEETALLESIEGKRGQVRAKPPLPAISGLFGCPTVINNVLTLAAVPFIIAEGAQAYADIGFGRSRGTMPIQLAGNIKNGGLFEIGFGITLGELVHDIGGGTASGRPVKAVQVGGPLGAYIHPNQFNLPFDYEAFAEAGALIGHAGITVFDDSADMGAMARFAMEFCAVESCGKCTPCRIGSTRGVEVIDRMLAGDPAQEEILRDLCETMQFGSLCALGGFTPYPVLSALDHFPQDFHRPPVLHEAAE